MGLGVEVITREGVLATYAKLSNYIIEISDKKYIRAIFNLYSSKENRDNGLSCFSDRVEFVFTLEKDFKEDIEYEIFQQAKLQSEFINAVDML